ncbi:MAG: hypothetical protein QOJ42_145 [Acidobacteriaceae bacterium]|nr:hypothetical protein [Acidobacteriaceae bacterium]
MLSAKQEEGLVSIEHFRNELWAQIGAAIKRGEPHILINSGELHRAVGGYPGPDHRMPTCCDVMRAEMQTGDSLVESPEKGNGANLTIRYMLPRGTHAQRS